MANASYLIHLYEEKGDHFFRELNGWFSGAILIIAIKRYFLFNDVSGMQRIFVHEDKMDLLCV